MPATLAIAGALLAVWEGLVAPHLPPPVFHPNRGDRALFWVAPREGPYYVVGDPSRAETVFLGDSRVFEDVVLDLAEGGGLGRCATVWGPAADLPELLRAVRDLPAARFVVGVSAVSLGAERNPIPEEILRERPPDFGSLTFEHDAARWVRDQRVRLLGLGFDREQIELYLDRFRRILRHTMVRAHAPTERLDRRLAEALNLWRARRFRTLSTRFWRETWLEPVDPDEVLPGTRRFLAGVPPDERSAALDALAAELHRLRSGGATVVLVRFPVRPPVLAIEREYVPDAAFEALARDVGVRYLDDAELDLPSRDGSHLTWPAAEAYTRTLVRRLLETEE